ncbi:RNase adapter RapZ [Jannaschia sp. R86511]|uniref:RNase adapter RapZ n=1 Tax=Jannaschia sp. R86511 TaxID=3093853 RepID=UPI0036D28BC8
MTEQQPGDDSEVLIITGLSGAGHSTVSNVLEDDGWFVVDNLPPQMLPPLAELTLRAAGAVPRLAVAIDVRGRTFTPDLSRALDDVRAKGMTPVVLFLDAADRVLVRRFESVRRPHPMQPPGTILDAIAAERKLLQPVRDMADLYIDTSETNVHQLAAKVRGALRPHEASSADLHLTVLSFGFKHGIPVDAENIADVRFLPNPHWVPELRPRNGMDADVAEYVFADPAAQQFVDAYSRCLEVITKGYREENKRFAVVAVGCTGGKHRSVAVAEALVARLAGEGVVTHAVHRDLGRE